MHCWRTWVNDRQDGVEGPTAVEWLALAAQCCTYKCCVMFRVGLP